MRQQNLVVILARDLADKLATAVFVVDEEGTLLYFNEQAGRILGTPFSRVGRLRMEEWAKAFAPFDLSGRELSLEEEPLVIAVRERRPAHRPFVIRSLDGTTREIEVTAFPLFAHKEEFVGAVAIFWEREEPQTEEQDTEGMGRAEGSS